MIGEGTFKAKPTDWGVVERGDFVKAMISFKTENDEHATWTGSLDDLKYVKYTLGALKTCGFDPKTQEELIEGLAAGVEGGKLNTDGAVEIVVEHTETQTGKTYANVRYINKEGASAGGKLDGKEAAQRLKNVNLSSLFGGNQPAPPKTEASGAAKGDLDGLPF